MLIQTFSYIPSNQTVPRLLRLGMYYQGGYVIYLTGNWPEQSGLIVAPAEISSSSAWPSIGGVTTPVEQGYGFGYSNTEAAFNAGYTTGGIGSCWNYANDGYTDWFMPSTNELILVIQNQSQIPYTLNAAGYHASSAYGPNPANQNFFVYKATALADSCNHSDLKGVLACRYITT